MARSEEGELTHIAIIAMSATISLLLLWIGSLYSFDLLMIGGASWIGITLYLTICKQRR